MDDPDVWRWIWLVGAAVLAVGEMATMGFFLAPFALGALVAAGLAFLGVSLAIQLVAFALVSVAAFAALRPLARRLDRSSDDRGVGARRLVGASALVLSDNPGHDFGMIRVGAEEWRAESTVDETIPAGAFVVVLEVRGTRAVVVAQEAPTPSPDQPN